ncbi:MAG: DUF2079 domain-containing protein [Clostridia bacterium]|nr:DUF2079 domain-containing protein [Clostridia bacterium]
MQTILNKLRALSLENFIVRFLAAWCVASVVLDLLTNERFTSLEGYADVSLWLTVLGIGAVFLLLTGMRTLVKMNTDILCLPPAFAVYSVLTTAENPDWYYAFILTALWAVLVFYYDRKGYLNVIKPLSGKRAAWIVAAAAVLFVLAVGMTGVFRYLAYRTPNFDFGIFCQMFYNMKTRLVPLTTCERDTLLSHFAVHISPICYLLLPFYAVFSSPVTLQVAQTLLLVSGIAPLILLSRKYGLSHGKTALAASLFLLYPAVAAGTNYDFHENCFLLPLLLWTFYFFEKEKYLPMAGFAALTLLVKEDAAVYLVFFAVYILLDRKRVLPGAALAIGAVVYFLVALTLLSFIGDGVMEGRYSNFIVAGGGLPEAVKNVLANPGYAFTQLLIDEHGEVGKKLLFLFQIFVPTAFLPFCVKKISRLTLLFPLLLINLLTVYPYQYDIGFQYSFGSAAFLFYLCVINLSEMREDTARRLLLTGLAACSLCFIAGPVNKCCTYVTAYAENREALAVVNETLKELPDDASVVCSTFLLPHLSKRDTLYEVHYHEPAEDEQIDYVILDARYAYTEFLEQYQTLGYTAEQTVELDGTPLLVILTRE